MNNSFLVIFALSLVLGMGTCFDFHEKELESEDSLWEMYERWRTHHTVSKSVDEKHKRFNVFKANAKYVHSVNKEDRPYKLKLNKYADLTSHEFSTMYAGSKIKHHIMLKGNRKVGSSFMYENVTNVPASVDWRKKGSVTAVKDQGQCGSCWAFSTVVTVEGINHIKTSELVSLSEQELVDCDTQENQGCNGGLMDSAFEFIEKQGGIATEEVYPYKATGGKCDPKKENSPAVSIDGHEDVPYNDEDALVKAAANQPVAVAIDAGSSDFQFYSEGVFSGHCGTELNHGVAVVGYGTTLDGTKYWVVKNSWGTEWGEKGYIRMQRGIRAKEGLCGIAMQPSYPIKTSSVNPKGPTAESTFKDEL